MNVSNTANLFHKNSILQKDKPLGQKLVQPPVSDALNRLSENLLNAQKQTKDLRTRFDTLELSAEAAEGGKGSSLEEMPEGLLHFYLNQCKVGANLSQRQEASLTEYRNQLSAFDRTIQEYQDMLDGNTALPERMKLEDVSNLLETAKAAREQFLRQGAAELNRVSDNNPAQTGYMRKAYGMFAEGAESGQRDIRWRIDASAGDIYGEIDRALASAHSAASTFWRGASSIFSELKRRGCVEEGEEIRLAGQETADQAGADALKEDAERLSRDIRAGRMDAVDLTSRFAQSGSAADGKTVIQNRPGGGLIVETIDPNVITAEDANKSAAAGGATHGFFYRGTDFLLDAAKEYTTLGENEEFAYRNIADVNFVRDALDFFTNGNYSQSDVNAVQEQMTEVVRELARQIKNGEDPDLSKLQSKLTIGGADVTISQLTDMQKMGRELSDAFNGITSGSLTANNIEAFAKMGIAKSLGNYYGSGRGEIGKLFSSAVDRLYEKGMAQVEKAEAWARTASYAAHTSGGKDAVQTERSIAELFSKLDTGSKSGLEESFSSVLSRMRALVRDYCDRRDLRISDVGLAGATDNISKFFHNWAEKL